METSLPEESEKAIPQEGSQPISRFVCHMTDRKTARDTIDKLIAGADPAAKKELAEIRLDTKSGVIKNRLVGMTPEDVPVFAIHMQSGRPMNPADCLLRTV